MEKEQKCILTVSVPLHIKEALDKRAKDLSWTRSQLIKEYLFLAVQNLKLLD
jgi:hypothetical protein